ncbi:MAG: chemotaxis protein CheW [Ignavibacteriaceae bacterium]|jgi:purine-binding chemotaxis protein CheW
MSKTIDNKNDSNELLHLVSFKIGNEEFGINILIVQEIIKTVQITKVPNAPVFVER